MMNNKESRMKTLKNAGINTGKYFSLNLPEGLKPGSTINIMISEDGNLIPINAAEENNDKNEIEKTADLNLAAYNNLCKCISNKYIRNTKLHRRWIMAQMFKMLNYESFDGKRAGYDAYLNDYYDYNYQFKMMLDEIKVLSVLEKKDRDVFYERLHFFNKEVVIQTCKDYLNKLKKYIESLPIRKCKGTPYVRISGNDVFVEDLNKKIFSSIEFDIYKMSRDSDFKHLYCSLNMFIRKYINVYRLPATTVKCRKWKDAFKGAGSYYTLMNLVRFHNCKIYVGSSMLYGMNAVRYVEEAADFYEGSYYKLFALLKKVISDNEFDFTFAMKNTYSGKK